MYLFIGFCLVGLLVIVSCNVFLEVVRLEHRNKHLRRKVRELQK